MNRLLDTATRHRTASGLGAIIVAVAIGVLIFVLKKTDEPPAPEPVATVTTAAAASGSLSGLALAYGTIASAPRHTSVVTMPYDGMIESVQVHDGGSVRAGEPMVTVSLAPTAAVQSAQARSALDLAKQNLDRMQRLAADRLVSNDQVAAARKAFLDAQAEVDQQRKIGADQAEKTLRAPFDGVVTGLTVMPGDRIQANATMATLSSRSDLIVQLGLEPEDAVRLAAGAAVQLAVPFHESAVINTQLASVGAMVDPTSRLVKAVAEIPAASAGSVALGMTLVAHINLPERKGILIPRAALLEDAAGPFVFTLAGGKAHRQAVKILVETDESALIGDGVAAGARVVIAGNAGLEDNMAAQESKQ